MKKFLIITGVMVLGVALGNGPIWASHGEVNLIRSNVVVGTYTGTTQASIQSALDAAQAGDVIELESAVYQISSTLVWPNVNNLTLRGVLGTTAESVILDGVNTTRIMSVSNNVDMTIEGIQFYRGKAPDGASAGASGENGGAIYKTGSGTLTILRSKFESNSAGNGGNGVAGSNGSNGVNGTDATPGSAGPQYPSCGFTGEWADILCDTPQGNLNGGNAFGGSAGGDGTSGTSGGSGGLGGSGGAIYNQQGSLIIESSIFTNNISGAGGQGGTGGNGGSGGVGGGGASGGAAGYCISRQGHDGTECILQPAIGYLYGSAGSSVSSFPSGNPGNRAGGGAGGNGGLGSAIYLANGTGVVRGTTFYSNSLGTAGSPGAMGSTGSGTPSAASAGQAGNYAAIYSNLNGAVTVINTLFDTSVTQVNTNQDIQSSRILDYDGANNTNANFSLLNGLFLPPEAQMIDGGQALIFISSKDYYGSPRSLGNGPDLGAVEFKPSIVASDPDALYQALNLSNTPVAYNLRSKTLITKSSGLVSASVKIMHTGANGIPTTNVDSFGLDELKIETDLQGLGVVSVTGNMRSYLNTQNPIGQKNKYIEITIDNIPTGKAGILYVKKDNGDYQSLIKYEADGSASLVTGLSTEDQNRVDNIVRSGNQITFRAYRFSQYGVATIAQVQITPLSIFGSPSSIVTLSAQVLDTNGEAVEGAPVTFNIVSGTASFPGLYVGITDATGYAHVLAQAPSTWYASSGFTAISDGVSALQNGYIATFEAFTSRIIRPATSNIIFDNDTFNTNGNVNLPTQILKIFGVELVPSLAAQANIAPNEVHYFPVKIINKGNASDVFTVSLNNTVANWDVSFIDDSNNDGIHQVGEVTILPATINVSYQSSHNFFLKFIAPASGGPFTAAWQFSGTSFMNDGPQYTGFDALTHGDDDSAYATRNAAIMDLIPPTINFLVPARNSTGNATNVKIVFRIFDEQSGVSYNSIELYVSGNLISKATPQIVTSSVTNGFWVTFNPQVNFDLGQTVAVSINASDLWTTPNVLNFYYTFDIVGNPILVLTQQINQYRAPTANGYSGTETDLVPGGLIEYRAHLSNQGYSTAVSTNLEIKVPSNTHFYNYAAQSGLSAQYMVGGTYQSSAPVDLTTVQRVKFTVDTISAASSKNIIYRMTVD